MITEFKGTNGEWYLSHSPCAKSKLSDKVFKSIKTSRGIGGQIVANAFSTSSSATVNPKRAIEEAEANAKLMSASKKLLEALQLVVTTQAYKEYVQGGPVDKKVQEALKDAL